jgi:hypothetical protein
MKSQVRKLQHTWLYYAEFRAAKGRARCRITGYAEHAEMVRVDRLGQDRKVKYNLKGDLAVNDMRVPIVPWLERTPDISSYVDSLAHLYLFVSMQSLDWWRVLAMLIPGKSVPSVA